MQNVMIIVENDYFDDDNDDLGDDLLDTEGPSWDLVNQSLQAVPEICPLYDDEEPSKQFTAS